MGGSLQLDEVVVSSVGGEEGAGVLEVLALGVALERLHHRLVVLPGKIFTRRSQDGRLGWRVWRPGAEGQVTVS